MDDTVISPSVLSVRSSSSSSGIPVDSMSSEVEEDEMLVVGSTVNLNGGGDDNDDEESPMDDTSVGDDPRPRIADATNLIESSAVEPGELGVPDEPNDDVLDAAVSGAALNPKIVGKSVQQKIN